MARGDFPSAKQPQFVLRFPDGMRDRIKVAAEANGRSMNAEIVERLDESFTFPSTEDRLQARIVTLDEEAQVLQTEIEELRGQIGRENERRIEYLAEIRSLRADRQNFDKEIERREAEIANLRQELGEVHQILRNYAAHSENLRKLEEHVRVLSAHLPAISTDDALKQMRRERKDEE